MPRPSPQVIPLLAFGVLLLADLLVKAWASQHLPAAEPRTLIPGLLDLNYTLNTGMAWGLLPNLTLPLALLRLLVGLGVVAALFRGRIPGPRALALGLIGAGALSNAVDGLTRGAVVDYLTSPLLDRVHLLLSTQSFPIFNGADMLVLAGVVLLVLTPAPRTALRPQGDHL